MSLYQFQIILTWAPNSLVGFFKEIDFENILNQSSNIISTLLAAGRVTQPCNPLGDCPSLKKIKILDHEEWDDQFEGLINCRDFSRIMLANPEKVSQILTDSQQSIGCQVNPEYLVKGKNITELQDRLISGLGMGYPTNPSHPTSPTNPGMGFLHPKLGLVGFVGLLLVKS